MSGPGRAERLLAARVLDALLREDYGGLRRYAAGDALRLPGGPVVRLRGAGTAAGAAGAGVTGAGITGAGITGAGITGAGGGPPGGELPGGELPGGGLHPGFLAERVVDPEQGLRLADVLAAVRRVADPRDDVEGFARECREALATALLHEATPPPGSSAAQGVHFDALAARTDHPVYPTGRRRAGLDEADLRRYAPEFAPAFALRWAAVPRSRGIAAGRLPEWWPGPGDVGLATRSGIRLLPVHPLTARAGLPAGAVLAPRPYLEVRPTLSMRTVAVDAATHLKMPLPTSTLGQRNRRTITPGTLPDGALVERLLRRVLAREPHLPVLLADEQTYGHAGDPLLGYLVRRFPAEAAGAVVVPVAALLAAEPGGGYVIERWDVPALFEGYLGALFDWNVTLFRYGIALEAHQQNVSLVLGERLKLLLKDNDGALIHPDRQPAAAFNDPRMLTRDPEALARVFVTITVHLCAGALAFGLAERGLLPLRTGLRLIRERLDGALGPRDAFLRARTLDAARLPTKAMVTAGTLVDKARTGAKDINKHYGPPGPNYLLDDTCP